MTLSQDAAGWVATILFAALATLFAVTSVARSRAAEVEAEAPHAVPASRNGQRRKAQAVGRLYLGWALLGTVVTLAAAIPSAIVLSDVYPDAPISWQQCALVVVALLWLAAAVRMWVRAARLLKGSWLN